MADTNAIKAGEAYVAVHADTSGVAEEVDKGVLHELKHGLGGRSDFKEIFELLKGGGAVVGLGVAAEALKGMAEGATRVKESLIDVNKNAADVGQSVLKSIPIISTIEAAGESWNNFFTGQEDAAAEAKHTSEAADAAIKKHNENVKAATESYRVLDQAIRHIRERGELIPGAPLGRSVPGFLEPFGAGGIKALHATGGELSGLLDAARGEREKFAGVGGEDLRKAEGNLADLKRKLDEANERVRHVEEREAANVHVVGGDKIKAEQRDLADQVRAAQQDVTARKATVAGINDRQTEGVFAAFYNFGRDIANVAREALADSFKAEQEKIRSATLSELQAYDAQLADDAARDDARANVQIAELDKRNARKSGQSSIENELANQKQALLDSILPKGEQLDQAKRYFESLGIGRTDLEKLIRKSREEIFGVTPSAGTFNPFAADSVGGDVQARIAMAAETTAKNTTKIVNGGGLVYGP